MKEFMVRALLIVGLLTGFYTIAGADEIRVGGGLGCVTGILEPVKPHFEKAGGLGLVPVRNTPTEIIPALLSGKTDAAVVMVDIAELSRLARGEHRDSDISSLRQEVIGQSRAVVIVHRDNPVAKLTKEQLKGIFTGKIADWKAVGGSASLITVVWGRDAHGPNVRFAAEILEGARVTKQAVGASGPAGIRDLVAGNVNAIGICPAGLIGPSVRVPEAPVLSKPIVIVTNGEPSPGVRRFIDYLKAEGKDHIDIH